MILMGRLRSARVTKVLEKAGEMSVYESAALPTELRRLFVYFVQFTKWLEGGCCTSAVQAICASSRFIAAVTTAGTVLM